MEQIPYQTLNDVFIDRTNAEHRLRPYLYYKSERDTPYKAMNNGDFGDRVRTFTAGLHAMGVRRGDRIALIAESRPEWVITDFSALSLGAITVPMFPTLTAKQVEQILAHSAASVAIVSNDLQLGKVIKSLPQCPDLKAIVVMNDTWQSQSIPLPIHSFSEIAHSTEVHPYDFDTEISLAKPEDVITIIYTSGTTGIPKGVMLTHSNLISNIEGALGSIPPVGVNDMFLSFLPLSHGFERLASYLAFYSGAQVAYAESIDTVAANMLEVRPTIITGVPRFFERIYGRLMRMRDSMTDSKRKIFDWSIKVGTECAKQLEGEHPKISAVLSRPIADMLVLKKIRARTGGRIRFFVSGGAALPAEIGKAFAAFGMIILEGYGMTESSPVISVVSTSKIKWGTVGKPLANIEVEIAPDGEILTRGPHVMKGYYRSPQETDEAIDSNGWLHTGDIGILDSDGYLKITDRKKHLFISEGGKNIAPGPIESLLQQSPLIDQVMLIGDRRAYNSALIVPDFDILKEKLNLAKDMSHQEIIAREDVRSLFESELSTFQKDLASYERARRFALMSEAFTIENEMMTPTLKIKRKVVEGRYTELIEGLYRDLR